MITFFILAALMEFAEGQHGLITPEQAESCGCSRAELRDLVLSGIAEDVFGGAVRLRAGGRHPFPRLLAGWLLLEPASSAAKRSRPSSGVVSHRSAVRFYRIGDFAPPVPQFTAALAAQLSEASAVLYRAQLADSDWRLLDDLPVTTPARTVDDLVAAEVLTPVELEEVVRGFLAGGWATVDELSDALQRARPDHWRELVAMLRADSAGEGSAG